MTDAIPMTVLKVSHHSALHIAQRYPYAAYGSNLMMAQISERCPHAELMTAGRILDYRLDFARVATITADKSSNVPVGIYKLTESDIQKLDKKEGVGKTYDRVLVTAITDDNRALRCFSYIKKDSSLEPPTPEYFQRLVTGYRDWRFEDRRLRHARQRAQDAWNTSAPARAAAEKVIEQFRSAGTAYAQGEMWEPQGNVVPMTPKYYVCVRHKTVEWGERDNVLYFRVRGSREWYRDVSGHNDIQAGMVRGELADNLPGAQAYRPRRGS